MLWYAKHCERTQRFIAEIEEHSPRPWAKPSVGFLEEAGGAALEVLDIDGQVLCIHQARGKIGVLVRDGEDICLIEYDKTYGSQKRHKLSLGEFHEDWVHSPLKTFAELQVWMEGYPCAAFSDDRKTFVTGYRDGTLLIWDADSKPKPQKRLKAHTSAVKCVLMSGDGTRIASGSWDNTLRVWEAKSGELLEGFRKKCIEGIDCVAMSSNGKRVVCKSSEGNVFFLDGDSGEAVGMPPEIQNDNVSCVAVSSDGSRLVFGTQDGVLRLWNVDRVKGAVQTIEAHAHCVQCIALSSDGRRIVTGSADKTLRVWDSERDEMIMQPFEGHNSGITFVAVSADGTEMVSASSDKTVRLWEAGYIMDLVHHPERCTYRVTTVYGDHRKRIVSASHGNLIRVWDDEKGEIIGEPLKGGEPLKDDMDFLWHLAVCGNGKRILSCSLEGRVCVWDMDSGETVGQAFFPEIKETNLFVGMWDTKLLSVNNDGTRVVSCLRDTVLVYDIEVGSVIGRLEGHRATVECVALSRDESRILSGSYDSTVRI